jgi:cysteine synthase A
MAKLEQYNPCASVKDRPAFSMIDDAEKRGLLKPGATIIEATSGNTGIGLAFIAATRDYKLVIVMPESMSSERKRLLELFGATVELTQDDFGMKGSIDKALEIHKRTKGSFLVGQFDNPANVQVHEQTTAEEILRDTDGKIDVLIAGIGTGGTITGVGKRLIKHNPDLKIIGVEPDSSAVLSGQEPGPHSIQGIGAGFVPNILDASLLNEIIQVKDDEAVFWARKIIREEGVLAGLSSGAVACACDKYIQKSKVTSANIVLIFPDTGERYLSFSGFMET